MVNIQAVSFPGDAEKESIFQVRHGESLKKFVVVDGGIQTEHSKAHGLSTTPFVKELVGL